MIVAGCLWCGATPLTREHVVPEWLLEVLMDMTGNTEGFDLGWEYLAADGSLDARSHGQANPAVVVRAVCRACNGGWMNRLESAAMPIVEPLVRGMAIRMTVEEQTLLARWAAKTAVMFEGYKPGAILVSSEDLQQIRHEGIAPPSYHIRLAYRADALSQPTNFYVAGFFASPVGVVAGDDDVQPNGFTVTLGIGHLAICINGGPAFNRPERWRSGGDSPLMIWPPTAAGIAWPPAHPIVNSNDDLRSFHEGLFASMRSSFRAPNASAVIEARGAAPSV